MMPIAKAGFSPTRTLIAVSLAFGSIAAVPTPAAACQAAQPGCVLPVDGVPPPPVTTAPPPPIIEEDRGFRLGWLAILGLLAALAAIAFLVLDDDDEDVPISP